MRFNSDLSDSFAHGFIAMCTIVWDVCLFFLLLFGVLFLIYLFCLPVFDVWSIEETRFEPFEEQFFEDPEQQQEFAEGKCN